MMPHVRRVFALLLAFSTGAGLVAQINYATPYAFTTLAGNAGYGSADGVGSAARFGDPRGMAMDGAGNIYVADRMNHTIRKIASSGLVTTFAGQPGNLGSADGVGGDAQFCEPAGVAVDGAGNVYVADAANYTIRKISRGGLVTTLAGTARSNGSTDGTGSAARFYWPTSVAVDGTGNVYVADYYNSTIRKITSDGVVTTLAGLPGSRGSTDGTGSGARFNLPSGVAVDGAGNIYVADSGNHVIRKITSAGVVTTLAGVSGQLGYVDGTGDGARFNSPSGMTVDGAGNLFVADTGNHTIRRVTPAGAVTIVAGSTGVWGSGDSGVNVAQFHSPQGVAVDGSGFVFVADSGNNTIRKIGSGGVVTTFAGSTGGSGAVDGIGEAARFLHPAGVAADEAGNVFVADLGNSTIRKISNTGVVTTLAGLAGSSGSADGTGSAARFSYPHGVAVDRAGNVYVADAWNSTIRKITSAGVVTTLAGLAGADGSTDGAGSAARFGQPYGVAVDDLGNVYVADWSRSNIRKITSSGAVTTLAVSTAAVPIIAPSGVAVDGAGNVYVAASKLVLKITGAGVVTKLAGAVDSNQGAVDGNGGAANFGGVEGVAVDNAGNVFVLDSGSIRKITSSGDVTTLAGKFGLDGAADGVGSSARFHSPEGIALDSAGRIFVADTLNSTIRVGTLATVGPRVVNFSIRSAAGTGSQTLIIGFVIAGAGTKSFLLRGVGPSLAPMGVANFVSDPLLRLMDRSGAEVASNDDWGGAAPMAGRFSSVGAFALPANSKDSALCIMIPNGVYSYHVVANGTGSGVSLAELYDADATEVSANVVNVSARTQVGTGENILIAGFVITGNAPKTLLIRGLGPTLTAQGVTGALVNPQLYLFGSAGLLANNDDWGGTTALKNAFAATGAGALIADASKDAALLVTLQPGVYSAQVSGVGGTTGVGLVEIFLMP